MKKLTRRQTLMRHRRHWKDVVKTNDKFESFERLWPGIVGGACWLCEYNEQEDSTKYCRDDCLVIWPKRDDGSRGCIRPGGLYQRFLHSNSKPLRKKLALQIANLPVNPKWKGVK